MSRNPTPDEIARKLEETPDEEAGRYLAYLAGFHTGKTQTKEPPAIILGSRSPRRELILGKLLSIEHQCLHVDVHEHVPPAPYAPDIVSKCLTVQKFIVYMKDLGRIKAKGNVLLVSDTVVVDENGQIVGKEPEHLETDEEKFEYCRDRIMSFMGKPTIVYSSIIVVDLRTEQCYLACDSVVIHFREPGADVQKTIDAYCAHVFNREEVLNHRGPTGKAGSFGIQEPEILYLVEKIEGDITVAVGLPAELTRGLLNTLPGISLPHSYDPVRCVDIVLAQALSDNPLPFLPFEIDLRSHALSLISS